MQIGFPASRSHPICIVTLFNFMWFMTFVMGVQRDYATLDQVTDSWSYSGRTIIVASQISRKATSIVQRGR